MYGCIFTFGNNLSTATYRLLVKKFGVSEGPEALSSLEIVFFNSVLGVPVICLLAMSTDEISLF